MDLTKQIDNFFVPHFAIKELRSSNSLVYIELITKCDVRGYLDVDVKNLSDLCGVTKSRIKASLDYLSSIDLIEIFVEPDISEQLKSKNLEGYGVGNKKCEWCSVRTTILHKHHYPIFKSKGGRDVVEICSNCHNEFHYHDLVVSVNLSFDELNELNKNKLVYNGGI